MKSISTVLYLWFFAAFSTEVIAKPEIHGMDASTPEVAFLADVHFHDVFSKLTEHPRQGAKLEVNGAHKQVWIRSMSEQLQSTRLFNENYFVFKAALDDLVARKIKYVALPGDFTDDGQPLHLRGLVALLKQYEEQHQMQFFAITGNHDPVRPHTRESGDKNFLLDSGDTVSIYSKGHPKCLQQSGDIVCSNDMLNLGYEEIMGQMAGFGFMPEPSYLLYETPFTRPEQPAISFEERHWNWCQGESCFRMPDASYLVEPVDGLWLLAIDANVYIPREPSDPKYSVDPFKGSSNAGYNALLEYKPELIRWITNVVQRAQRYNKRLIAFSHFPMTDFDETSKGLMEAVFGKDKLQQKRIPRVKTSKVLAGTGLQVHVGGHMHINDTGKVVAENGNVLLNIQAPTLAAYQPGYKTLQISRSGKLKVDTVILSDVPNFDLLFPLYRQEHHYLTRIHAKNIWAKNILLSKNYEEFTEHHLKALVERRYLQKDWPVDLAQHLQRNTIGELVATMNCEMEGSKERVDDKYGALPAVEIAYDFQRLRSADSMANIAAKKLAFYRQIKVHLINQRCVSNKALRRKFIQLLSIIENFANGDNSGNFILQL